MKIPLEPIPTDEMVAVDSAAHQWDHSGAGKSGAVQRAYPWLLGTSVCLSGVLCWLYVTKPVIVSAAPQQDQAIEEEVSDPVTPVKVKPQIAVTPNHPEALVPSDHILPGETPALGNIAENSVKSDTTQVDTPSVHNSLEPLGGSFGWENTNLKVQHILRADLGTGDLEKIILDVPVRYETRTMRWARADIAHARTVLSRLMVYERDLNDLRQQGKGILKDWNSLLERTVPASVLRADSPSLPYIHSSHGDSPGLPHSSSVIKVENSEANE